MRRRTFLLGAGQGCLLGAAAGTAYHRQRIVEPTPVVSMPGMREGHQLRDLVRLPPSGTRELAGIVILGSGVAGLTCAWKLAQAGRHDFIVLAGPEPDGNAAGADLASSGAAHADNLRCPTGAHYLPLPSTESHHVRELLADLELLDDPNAERLAFDERALGHAPHERLLREGKWLDGLLPDMSTASRQSTQQQRFFAVVERLREQRGSDGRRVFAIPAHLSSQDPQWRALDRQTFAQWLKAERYDAPALRWYLDYCCRDDYGAGSEQVSAWAGLHYFAARNGHASNAQGDAVLTWPGGLSELTRRMRERITARLGHARWLRPGFAVRIADTATHVDVLCAEGGAAGFPSQITSIRAERVVSAVPLHVLRHLWPGLQSSGYRHDQHGSPHAAWLVSNFLMEGLPTEAPGQPLAWDNVVEYGQGLGYVVSTHQLLRVAPPRHTVLTAYRALDQQSPQAARHWLLQAGPDQLRAHAASDLLAAYGQSLWRHVRRLEITVRGHAMAVPTPGFLDNPGLAALRELEGRVLVAHSDLSGYSIFEEAAWWGVHAATSLL